MAIVGGKQISENKFQITKRDIVCCYGDTISVHKQTLAILYLPTDIWWLMPYKQHNFLVGVTVYVT